MISKEQHMKMFENQRNNYEQIKQTQMRTTEKNNEKPKKEQWQYCGLGLGTLKLRIFPGCILKYPKRHGFWRHSKFKNQNFGKLVSILKKSVSL